jgi:hypothetical protein
MVILRLIIIITSAFILTTEKAGNMMSALVDLKLLYGWFLWYMYR